MGQSRQEFGFQERRAAALAAFVVGINGLLSPLYVAKMKKWLLPMRRQRSSPGQSGTTAMAFISIR
jgi:hypothetical protein